MCSVYFIINIYELLMPIKKRAINKPMFIVACVCNYDTLWCVISNNISLLLQCNKPILDVPQTVSTIKYNSMPYNKDGKMHCFLLDM